MRVNVRATRSIRIDGKDYASLDEVPADKREAVAKAIESLPATLPAHLDGKLTVNGQEYSASAEVPATLRSIVDSALSSAANARLPEAPLDEEIRPEPVITLRNFIIFAAAAVVLLALVARWAL